MLSNNRPSHNVEWYSDMQKIQPFPKRQILYSSKLKEFADDNFKTVENDRKHPKQLENTVVKGEIALYEQFSFSYCVFKRLVQQTRKNQACLGNG